MIVSPDITRSCIFCDLDLYAFIPVSLCNFHACEILRYYVWLQNQEKKPQLLPQAKISALTTVCLLLHIN